MLLYVLLATFLDGLISLVGIFSLWVREKTLDKLVFVLVSFSTGALLGGAFFHLLEESLENLEPRMSFSMLIMGFSLFFMLERVIKWHHCHQGRCDVHPFTYMILLGDGIHNFIDGLIIAAAFSFNLGLGVVTTLAIISHEIPQELGDFSVLIFGGMEKKRALFCNFLSQLTCVLGGLGGYMLSGLSDYFSSLMLPFAAGGFIYISASDLIPELHKQVDLKRSLLSYLFFLLGLLLLYLL
mgnify:FL=1